MNLAHKLCAFFILCFALNSQAAVWVDNQSWSLQYEDEYGQWMHSSKVHEKLFSDPSSPYFGVSTDCADTAYALRAIFAFEHLLPFAIYSPSGSRSGTGTLNNRQSNWDNLPTNKERLIAMINEIGDSVGTENLAYFDTFPVAIKSINPGTVFMYKIKARFKKFIRHTYNITGINPVGTFEVIYSTQANKKKGLPLIKRNDKEFENAPTDPWGFRKFRWPELLGRDLTSIPKELAPSTEQFSLVATLGPVGFFQYVKKAIATSNESTPQKLARLFKSVCTEAQARVDYVNQGLIHLKETENKCMNYEEFDAYSTPVRDQNLKDLYFKLQSAYNEALTEGVLTTSNSELIHFSEIIFKNLAQVNTDLLSACPVNYKVGANLDLATLWKRMTNGALSSHPNDNVEARWGDKTSVKTKCKSWY
jgi:hypothetical protein